MASKRIDSIPPLPPRARDAHKGDFGRILVIAGQMNASGMTGAAALVANAALRSGAGLVEVATEEFAQPVVAALAPCATTRRLQQGADLAILARNSNADVVAIGPGLGSTVSGAQVLHLIDGFDGAVVIDADGLNALATGPIWATQASGQFSSGEVILTPHPGEMQRLREGLRLSGVPRDREASATELAKATGTTVVLKGAATVVTDGAQVYVNTTGNAGMATGGSGDVLTGVIAALAGQRMGPFDAAILGAHLHGLAGDLAAASLGEHGLIATDLVEHLPAAFRSHLSG